MRNEFVNEAGLTCYVKGCGCEGTFFPGVGWIELLCEECEDELDSMARTPVKQHKLRKFNDRQSI